MVDFFLDIYRRLIKRWKEHKHNGNDTFSKGTTSKYHVPNNN